MEFDVNRGKLFLYNQILSAGRHFSSNPFKIRKAARYAWQEHLRFYRLMAEENLTYPEAIGKISNCEKEENVQHNDQRSLHIGLVGHPYILHDEQISHRMISRLKQHGVIITTPEMLTSEQLREGMADISIKEYWTAEDDVVSAGGYYASHFLTALSA
jgi:hypothetical protein